MSYDAYLLDAPGGKVLTMPEVHEYRGGIVVVGGTNECWLNVTYNYSPIFYRVLGEGGLRSLNGQTGAESLPRIHAAVHALKEDYDPDYWKATEGNARYALMVLGVFARAHPEGVWDVH